MKMLSVAMALLLAVCSAVLLAACGDGEEGELTERQIEEGLERAFESALLESVTENDLAIMVLPQEDLGEEFADLEIYGVSGLRHNEEATDDTIDPEDTPGDLERAGRIGGYLLSFGVSEAEVSSVLEAGDGVISVGTEVELFRDAGAASDFLAKQVDDYLRLEGGPGQEGATLEEAETFEVEALADEAIGLRSRISLGEVRLYGTEVCFRLGRLVGRAVVARPDDTNANSQVEGIARALEERIHGVLLGDIGGAPATPSAVSTGKIAYESDRDGNFEIYLMNADGSGQTRLTDNSALDCCPAWSSDGTRIAFDSNRDDNYEVYVMGADGSGQTNLSDNPSWDSDASWSPDGSRIAFMSSRDGDLEAYVMNADGSGQARLTDNSASDGLPAWSPDGARIAFPSDRDGNGEIYIMNADGSGVARLTNNPADDFAPAWSPDGGRIAFHSNRDGNREIYVTNADGSGVARLTNNPADDSVPAWSPDGTRIAFTSDRDGNYEIYVMNADGAGQTRLTYNAAIDNDPAWSPVP